jgi:outer membrane protein TolC
VPIFSGFRRNARLQQAQIGMKQSKMQLEQTEQNLQLQIERARSNYQNALKTWENQKENIELAKRIRRKTNIKYTEGISTSFELNVAESQLLDAQSRYIQSILDLLNAKQELDKALNIY